MNVIENSKCPKCKMVSPNKIIGTIKYQALICPICGYCYKRKMKGEQDE